MDRQLYWQFKDRHASLQIKCLGPLVPEADNDWDYEAIDCEVVASAKPFKGSFRTTLWAHEFVRLRQALQTLVTGAEMAEFQSRDAALQLFIMTEAMTEATTSDHGHLLFFRVTLVPDPAQLTRLTFEMATNRSQVALSIDALNQILAAYPPRLQLTKST